MSRFRALILAAALASGLPSSGSAVAQERSPFIGSWQLDLTRMPANYGPPPKRVVYRFDELPEGRWRTTIDITAPDESVRHMEIVYLPNGQAAQSTGDTAEGESAAVLAPAPDTLVMSIAQGGHLGSVRTYVVSPDGSEMTEAAANVDQAGKPFVRTFRFRRMP